MILKMEPLRLLLFACTCFITCQGYNKTTTKHRLSLVNNLLANTSTAIRPGLDFGDTVVNNSLDIFHLAELNEVKGYITLVGLFTILWIDDRMTWEPETYGGIKSVTISSEKVWVPRLVIANGAESIAPISTKPSDVVFHYDGLAKWTPDCVIKTLCYMEIPAYPFDIHGCHIEIVPYRGMNELLFTTMMFTIGTTHFQEDTEWALINTHADFELPDDISLFPMAYFEVQFKRKPIFLVVYIVIPAAFLSVLNPVVFLMPVGSGERVSVSISVLLSFAVFQGLLGKIIPQTSSPMPYLCYYVLTVSAIGGLITILIVISERLFKNFGEKSVPKCLFEFLKILNASDTCHKRTASVRTMDESETGEMSMKTRGSTKVKWKHAIDILNKIFFVIYLVFAILCFLSFMLLVTNEQRKRIDDWWNVRYLPE